MIMCVYSSLRPPVCLAGRCTLAQTSSPQTTVPERRTFLVSYRRPNRPQGQQEVGATQSRVSCELVFYTLFSYQACLVLCPVAEEFDPEENLHSTEDPSHMWVGSASWVRNMWRILSSFPKAAFVFLCRFNDAWKRKGMQLWFDLEDSQHVL